MRGSAAAPASFKIPPRLPWLIAHRTYWRAAVAAAAASDDPAADLAAFPAAVTHPPTFHDDLALVEMENERLSEMAGSLRHRQKVGICSLADRGVKRQAVRLV